MSLTDKRHLALFPSGNIVRDHYQRPLSGTTGVCLALQHNPALGGKLSRLSSIISSYLDKLIKHNKSNTAFLNEIVILFSLFYSTETTYVISSFTLRTEL